jgi:SAM-dependent methyltransferase
MDIHEKGYWLTKDVTNTHDCDMPLCDEIIRLFGKVKSVIDIGCGNGGYTKRFLENKINCTGYDGSPLTPEITNGLCKVQDFSEPVDLGVFDLVLSLEVGEHIPVNYEQIFIDNLVKAAKKYIILSWGVEGQGGIGHVNCRNNDYVISQLSKRGFEFDKKASGSLRNKSTFPWFKNTVMVFGRKEVKPILDVFKGYESSLVSVVLTSCGRLDYLQRTIETFNKFNTFPIHEFIIVEDSGNKAVHKAVKTLYPDYTIICNPKNIGLVASIDKGYAEVKTPFIFHCEEDWEFTRSGFIEKSLEILLICPEIMQVWIRALNDTNGHPFSEETYRAGNTDFRLVAVNVGGGAWHGFTWNPGLRRLSDYEKVAPFNDVLPEAKAGEREMMVGIMFYKRGYRAAILPEGYIFHIGTGPKNYSLV